MKQVLTFGLFIFFFFIKGISQMPFTFKLGGNIATTKGLIQYPKNRIGFYTGFSSELKINKKFSLKPELIYSTKGERATVSGGDQTNALRFNYLNLPLLVSFNADERTKFLIGPEFGYLLSAKYIISKNNIDVSANYPQRYDVGTLVGIEYRLSQFCSVEARYIYGFNTLYYEDYAGIRHLKTNGANRVFQLGLAFSMIHLKQNKK